MQASAGETDSSPVNLRRQKDGGSLHGKSTLGKNAMIVLVNISTLSFAVLTSISGDMHLFYSSFSTHFMLGGINLLSVIF